MYETIQNICRRLGIPFLSYEEESEFIKTMGMTDYAKKYQGFCFGIDRDNSERFRAIFYDGARSDISKTVIMAHELGHIILGHIEEGVDHNCINQPVGGAYYCELLADVFSCVMLATHMVLDEMGVGQAVSKE